MVSSKQNKEVQHSNTRNNSRPVNQDGAWCTILVMHLRNHITMQHQGKLDLCALSCIFVGHFAN